MNVLRIIARNRPWRGTACSAQSDVSSVQFSHLRAERSVCVERSLTQIGVPALCGSTVHTAAPAHREGEHCLGDSVEEA